jgi:thiosulfate/3-mercaptopyruvate sulfurtransferase
MALISVSDLKDRLDDPHVRVVDVRWVLGQPGKGRQAYDEGHLPGAIFVDLDTVLTAKDGPGRHPLPDPIAFAADLGRLGIASDDFISVYDDVGGWVASRLWWMLDNLGHEDVAVLDGGYPAWVAAGLPTTTLVQSLPPADLELAQSWTGTIDRDELRVRLGDVILLDARAGPRYRGEVEPIDPVPGHIPGAVNMPYTAQADAVASDSEVAVYCGSGITAAVIILALEQMGVKAKLYPGSWSEWSSRGLAVERG